MSLRFITFSLFLVLSLGMASCEKGQDVVMEDEEATEAVAETMGSPSEEAAAAEGSDKIEVSGEDTDDETEEAVYEDSEVYIGEEIE